MVPADRILSEKECIDLIRNGHRWIDVRAPVEYLAGTLPNSVNLPILSDEERHQIGTCYKKQGHDQAVEMGHRLVSGENKSQKIQAWIQEIKSQPNSSLFCFRGGMRSQLAQQWLQESGISIRRLSGGYKAMRVVLTEYFRNQVENNEMRIISGPTGSWKTHLIEWITSHKNLAIDLEKHACHRGSAFGKRGVQPGQVNFEHALVKDILDQEDLFAQQKNLYLEDESRLIGRCVLPDFLFAKMRSSPILWLDEPIEQRVENIFGDYILDTDIVKSQNPESINAVYVGYLSALVDIKKRLGSERFLEIYKDMQSAQEQGLSKGSHESNRIWIRKILLYYYDPLYFSSLERRKPEVLIKARTDEIKSFISK